jgi:hypothetical protein
MKSTLLAVLAATLLASPVLAAGPQQQARQPAGPSWHWDPDVVGERHVYRHRNQAANQEQEQNMARDTDQNRFQEQNANKQQFQSQVNEPNNLGW